MEPGSAPSPSSQQQQAESPDRPSPPPAELPSELFSPATCLFCRVESGDTAANLSHMRKTHGLLIPECQRLVVDVEALLGYLHVVISELGECILCHTARRTAGAARQHMMGKGHCRIDLESEGAEMLEFYDMGDGDGDDDDETPARSSKMAAGSEHGDIRRSKLSLSMGKVALPRTSQKAHSGPRSSTTTSSLSTTSTSSSPPLSSSRPPAAHQRINRTTVSATTTTRQARLHQVFETQLSSLRAGDRGSMAHMPSRAQQLSVLAAAQRQREQLQRAERRARGRLEGKNNSTMMLRFRSDVPGPKMG
ncbi:pre-60S factor REI1 [Microdochium nivale]|nr:pre-60S factor REI1 [Microdochium nivale]